MRILVVDDEKIKRVSLASDLRDRGHDVITADDGEEAVLRLAGSSFDVVITDLRMPGLDGMELLERIKHSTASEQTEVFIMTAYGNIPLAVEAIKAGAYHFLAKPFSNEMLFPFLERIAEERRQRGLDASSREKRFAPEIEARIVGNAPAIREVKGLVDLCTRTDANVLILGETGTGKDLTASLIHALSSRREHPYIKVSCAVFPASLVESELFGHEKGAFTGADKMKPGRFELAEHGTIYMDDVDDVPLEQQVKLLRVIEEKIFERVGNAKPITADVRIVASTKKNLQTCIEEGTFRQDLYYRLKVLQIRIPPLRERLEDIPLLVSHLLKPGADGKVARVADAAMDVMQAYTWPGNVRELAYALERATLLGQGEITPDSLGPELEPEDSSGGPASGRFNDVISHTERDMLADALDKAGGNKSRAARLLGMKLSTFRDKLTKHGLS